MNFVRKTIPVGPLQSNCTVLGDTETGIGWVFDAGDTLFQGSVGRSDLPGGNGAQLMASIRNRLYPLNDATVVVAGHGPDTTLGHEKRLNAFVRLP